MTRKRYFQEYECILSRSLATGDGGQETDYRRLFRRQAEHLRRALLDGVVYQPHTFSWYCAMFYAISYDIRDDRRRLKVAKVLKDFGQRVQLSVFEARLDAAELVRLKKRLNPVVDQAQDSVRLYPLCGACLPGVEVLGPGQVTQEADFIII
jgi:CRISPR-associated protein Cas2